MESRQLQMLKIKLWGLKLDTVHQLMRQGVIFIHTFFHHEKIIQRWQEVNLFLNASWGRDLFFSGSSGAQKQGGNTLLGLIFCDFFYFFIFWLSDSHSRLCQIIWLVCLWGLWSGLRITYCSGHMLFSSLTFYCRQRWSDIKELL